MKFVFKTKKKKKYHLTCHKTKYLNLKKNAFFILKGGKNKE